ncbi:prolyl oligopeptidase family serine peptidase [Phenylobacterium sp. LjRoot164]|uniref:alpha/beta hydrolase family protein n=1 Tax=unclassified Phenylobacterium TaxID=2640670 RepID=UPI003ECF4186
MQRRVLAAAATAGVLGFVASAQAAPPPASAFGRYPAIAETAISPDGRRVGMLGGQGDKRFVSIATIDDPNIPVLPLGVGEGLDLAWIGNEHLLLRTAYWYERRPKEIHRFERHISINPQAQVVTRLLETERYSQHIYNQPIVALPSGEPAQVVVRGGDNGGNQGTVFALWRVDPTTGAGQAVARGDWTTLSWGLDTTGAVRMRRDIDYNRITDVDRIHFARPGAGSNLWTRFWSTDISSRERYLGYSGPEDAIYLFLAGGEVVRKRVADGATDVIAPASGDASLDMIWDAARMSPLAVTSSGITTGYTWLDPEVGAIYGSLSKIFKGQEVTLLDWSADRSRVVFDVQSRATAPTLYLFDRGRKEVSALGDAYPELKGVALGPTRLVSLQARDGRRLQAYLTLPPGLAAGTKPPLVVMAGEAPGNGPRENFDYMAQFMASRGYAVLQPYHRGLWGFGDEFYEAGFGEWNGKVQTDILDAVAAVASEVDVARPCIVGHDFGGYVALTAAALHPEAYRCAASFGGFSDLGLMMSKERLYHQFESPTLERLRQRIGGAGKAKLSGASPARFAGAVGGPVLLIHGAQDTEIDPEQSKVMADALKAAGKPVEHIVMKDEAHDFSRGTNRVQMLEALESFLAKSYPAS